MKIVTVNFSVADVDSARVKDLIASVAAPVRAMNGCLAYQLFSDPACDGSFFLFQKWEAATAFEDYKNSDQFALLGGQLTKLMSAPPRTGSYDATATD